MFTSILRRKTANIELSWPDFYIVLISSHKVNIFILTVRFLKSVGNEYLSNHSIKSAKIPSSCSYTCGRGSIEIFSKSFLAKIIRSFFTTIQTLFWTEKLYISFRLMETVFCLFYKVWSSRKQAINDLFPMLKFTWAVQTSLISQ